MSRSARDLTVRCPDGGPVIGSLAVDGSSDSASGCAAGLPAHGRWWARSSRCPTSGSPSSPRARSTSSGSTSSTARSPAGTCSRWRSPPARRRGEPRAAARLGRPRARAGARRRRRRRRRASGRARGGGRARRPGACATRRAARAGCGRRASAYGQGPRGTADPVLMRPDRVRRGRRARRRDRATSRASTRSSSAAPTSRSTGRALGSRLARRSATRSSTSSGPPRPPASPPGRRARRPGARSMELAGERSTVLVLGADVRIYARALSDRRRPPATTRRRTGRRTGGDPCRHLRHGTSRARCARWSCWRCGRARRPSSPTRSACTCARRGACSSGSTARAT